MKQTELDSNHLMIVSDRTPAQSLRCHVCRMGSTALPHSAITQVLKTWAGADTHVVRLLSQGCYHYCNCYCLGALELERGGIPQRIMQAKLLSGTFTQQLLMATELPSQLSSDVG